MFFIENIKTTDDVFCFFTGSDVKKENVGDIPCRVCGAPSSGFHFGALTCEGCKVRMNKKMIYLPIL